ncbi:caspase family protein [Alkalilacustris brevis]|uniref:caspase family protein n=1 Tax=Alkalilacustris brevis TaxID=2026338 RepID=UPI0013900B37|nr:caspase family protein [Alkalilacustris brevis]
MNSTITRRNLMMGTASIAVGMTLAPGTARLWASEGAARTYHALIVAVTDYPNLPPSNSLPGPNNDARLMREYLLTGAPVPFAPENVTLLADNLDGAEAPPSLSAIRQAMADLADRAGEGDFVYLQFSGHGHQQPARNPEQEIDGLDEVFMPRDTEMMTRENRFWPNAYVDKDIKEDLDRIRARGAFVWALFDCCHSATMTRNLSLADSGEVARKVDLASMDIPEDLWEGTPRGPSGTPRQTMFSSVDAGNGTTSPDTGGMVAFFASQTIEPTYEMPLPQGSDNPTQMGLFTFSVLEQLGRNPAITYRQLGDSVLQRYNAMGRRSPTPMFEGEMDAAVFAAGDMQYVPQWPVRDGDNGKEIAAGHVHQLGVGTRMAVLAGPTDQLEDALGLVEIASASAMRSTLGPVRLGEDDAQPDQPLLDPQDIPELAYVRMIEQVISMELAVSLPAESGPHGEERARISRLLQHIADDATAPFRLRLVNPGQSADLRFDVISPGEVLRMMEEQEGPLAVDGAIRETAAASTAPELWMLDAQATVSLRPAFRPPSHSLAGSSDEALETWLRASLMRIYRATNLSRMAVNDGFDASDITVELYLKRAGQPDMPLRSADVPFARPGNEVHLRVVNNSRRAVDVHALFIGADYSIVPAAHPERLFPGDPGLDRGLFAIADQSFGRERIVVALSDETDGIGPRLDLSYLAQSGVRAGTKTRAAGTGLRGLMQDLSNAAAPVTRSGIAMGAGPQEAREALLVYALDVTPET